MKQNQTNRVEIHKFISTAATLWAYAVLHNTVVLILSFNNLASEAKNVLRNKDVL